MDPAAVVGAEVVGHNGHHGVVEPEKRHKDKAVQLEEHPVNGRGGGAECQQDLVHQIGGDRADGVHEDGGKPDGVDLADELKIKAHFTEMDTHIGIVQLVQNNAQRGGNQLTDDGSDGGAADPHSGESQQAKDEDGIQNDIEKSAGTLDEHSDEGAARPLQDALRGDLHKDAERADADDRKVFGAVLGDEGGDPLLQGKVGMRKETAQQRKNGGGADRKQQADIGNLFGLFPVLLPQPAGKQRVDADAGAGGKGDHQVLDGKRQRNGGQGVLADTGNKDAVHNIVKRLDHHREDERQRHLEDQLFDRHGPHFVFCRK